METQQDSNGLGNRRPLHYVQELRQYNTELQSNVQSPQERSLPHSYDEMQYQPSLYDHTQQWPALAPKWPEETVPHQPPLPMPRGLNFNVNLPFGQKEHGSTNGDSNLYSFGVGYNSDLNKPSSFQTHAGTHVHAHSKPGFQLSLSLPIPPAFPSSKPSSSDETVLQEDKMPVHTKPDSTIVSSGHHSKPTTPTDSQRKIPTQYSWEFPKYPAPPLPVSFYQPDSVFSGYYIGQINPTTYSSLQSGQSVLHKPNNAHVSLFPSQYERHHSSRHIKPGSNNFGQPPTWQPDGTGPTFVPSRPTHGGWQIAETIPLPSPVWPLYSTGFQPSNERPFGYNKVVPTTNYAMGNVMQPSQSYLHQNSMGQSGWVAVPGHLSDFDTNGRQVDGESIYTKLVINS